MHSVNSSIIVHVPADFCYEAWCDFERFPDFMSRVVRVERVSGQGRVESGLEEGEVWRWEVRGPLGRHYDWDAVVVLRERDKTLSWAPVAGESETDVATSGSVNFLKLGPDRTLLEVKLTYSAPVPPFGELLADVLHYGDNLVDDSLREFRYHVERLYQQTIPTQVEPEHDDVMHGKAAIRERAGTPVTRPRSVTAPEERPGLIQTRLD